MEIFTTVFYRHHATGRRAVGARRMAPLMQAMFSTNSLCSSGDRDDFNINCIGHASGGLIETEAGWQSGPNLISLIDNCCLKRAMLVADGGLIFVVAEQSLDLPSLSTRTRKQVLSAFAHNLTGDGLLIYISDTRRVTLVRTAHATIPLYVSAEADRLNVSWDYHAVVAARGAVVLSRSELRYFILYGPQLAQETIVIGVKQLFAGQSASWSAGQTEIEIDPMIECESLEQSVLRPGHMSPRVSSI